MINAHSKGGNVRSFAIPVNRSEKEVLSPALRDLADLLAEIVARRLQAGPVKLQNKTETLGDD